MNSPIERPTAHADRIGRQYVAGVSPERRKRYGQFLTPPLVAAHMASLFRPEGLFVRLVDPGAGAGILTCAIGERIAECAREPVTIEATLYENAPELAAVLSESMSYLEKWLSSRNVRLHAKILIEDFVLANSGAIRDSFGKSPSLFRETQGFAKYDLAVSNPPYFKIPKSDPRAQAATEVIHGQPNIYALFMATAAAVLVPGGRLIFITPRSYLSGPYFRLFRERFFGKMKPELIHVFQSRTAAFRRDGVLQETMILKALRDDGWADHGRRGAVLVSQSDALTGLGDAKPRVTTTDVILDMSSRDKVVRVPANEKGPFGSRSVGAWRCSLGKMGLQISTGPVVPFRATEFLDTVGDVPETHAPLLWMHHIKAMRTEWPIPMNRKPQFIKVSAGSMRLLVPNRHYVLLRRFSAKEEMRRLVASPHLRGELMGPWLGIENHLNYIHRPGGEMTEEEVWGLAVLFNSAALDTYFRTLNGNTQVSATEVRSLPLPERVEIVELGARAKNRVFTTEDIDELVTSTLNSERLGSGEEIFRSEGPAAYEHLREGNIIG